MNVTAITYGENNQSIQVVLGMSFHNKVVIPLGKMDVTPRIKAMVSRIRAEINISNTYDFISVEAGDSFNFKSWGNGSIMQEFRFFFSLK